MLSVQAVVFIQCPVFTACIFHMSELFAPYSSQLLIYMLTVNDTMKFSAKCQQFM